MSPPNPTSSPPSPSSLDSAPALPKARGSSMAFLKDVEVEITLEIGRRRMRIADVLKLGSGQTLELAKAAGEPLDIFVNGRLLGRGEAVVTGDRYGVRITEIVAAPEEDGHS
jgi:flagellar motor switch protein FliN/FliY